jgi:O-antigen/teichoic acid export membrane protein
MELKKDSITEQDTQPQEPTLKEKTAKGLFWGGISNGVQQTLAVVIGIVLLKYLTPDDYGMVGLLSIFLFVAISIQESGFTAALTNRKVFKEEDYNSVFWFNNIIGCIIYVILYFSAPLIASFFRHPELILLSRVVFLSIVASSMGVAHNAILFRNLMVKEKAKIDIISITVSGSIGIYLAITGSGYWALAWQTVSAAFSGTILRWYFSPWTPTFSFTFKPIKEMFSFSVKLLFSNTISFIQYHIFSVLLGRYYTQTTEVGYYSQGMKWATMGSQVITGMVSSVAQPIFSKIKDDKERQILMFRKLIRFISFVSFPLMFGIAFVCKEFILLINDVWLPCIPILQLYAIWGGFAGINILYIQFAISHGRSAFYFWHTVCYAVIQTSTIFFALPFGIYWMAFAAVSIQFLFLLIWHIYVSRFTSLRFVDVIKDILPYLGLTCIILGIVYMITINIHQTVLLFSSKIVLSVFLYLVFMKISNSTIFKESLDFLRKNFISKIS